MWGPSSRYIGLMIALTWLLAACANNFMAEEERTTPKPASPSQASESASDISLNLYQGQSKFGSEQIELSAVTSSGQPIVLNFWAGLCPPCRLEMPHMDRVYDEYHPQIVMLGIDVGPFTGLGNRQQGRQLVDELGIGYPVGSTFDESIMRRYPILGMPTTYFIRPDGAVHERWVGLLTEEKLVELIEDLLAASGQG